jgi:hypothetical protein
VQKEILEAKPDAPLVVYAVFFEMVEDDRGAKARVDPRDLLDDPRATSYWDDAKVAGRWFDENVTKLGSRSGVEGRIEWDTFVLFGPDAEWALGRAPDHVSWGRPLYGERARLRDDLELLLAPKAAPGS